MVKGSLLETIQQDIDTLTKDHMEFSEYTLLTTKLVGVTDLKVVQTGCVTVGIPIGAKAFIQEQLSSKCLSIQ